MAVLSALMNALRCYYPHLATNNHQRDLEHFRGSGGDCDLEGTHDRRALLTASAPPARHHPKRSLSYCDNFLHLMFSEPYNDYVATPEVASALNLFLLLHADHEQNCSTSTVRMVGARRRQPLRLGVSRRHCAVGPAARRRQPWR
jgi:citrate synthase